MAEPLRFTLITPKSTGGSHETISAEPGLTGEEFKLRVQEVSGVEPAAQLLFFQNGSRNATKVVVDGAATLAAQGIEDNATITLRVNEQEVQPENSVLRQSIVKNGGSSYYYAHANEKELPPELRYVYGGAPAKLGEADAQEPAARAAAPPQPIEKYSWADEGDFVCVYISAEGEHDAVEAAKDGKGGEVKVEFGPKLVEIRIRGEAKEFGLVIRNLEDEIVPEESKHRISAGKRVTLKLKKKRAVKWMRLVKPQK